jgi:hypothetical protein
MIARFFQKASNSYTPQYRPVHWPGIGVFVAAVGFVLALRVSRYGLDAMAALRFAAVVFTIAAAMIGLKLLFPRNTLRKRQQPGKGAE